MRTECEGRRPAGVSWIGWIASLSAYSTLLCVATWKHTFWRDETEVWLLARASRSVTLLLHNIRYEGHPPLWYLVVYGLTRFSGNPDWMKLPNLLCAVASAALILSADKLRLVVRLGLAFSYYMLFEYALIVRNYMGGVALLLAAVTFMRRQPKPGVMPLILLSLAALTSLPALTLALCLALVYLWLVLRGVERWSWGRVFRDFGWARAGAASVFLVSAVTAAATILPPVDSGLFLETVRPPTNIFEKFLHCGYLLSSTYLPIPQWRHDFWGITAVPALTTFIWMSAAGWAVAVVLALFLRHGWVRYFYAGATALLVAEMMVSGRAVPRHVGWLFVVFVCALLLQGCDADERMSEGAGGRRFFPGAVVAAVLVCQVISGVFAISVSLRYPFSSSKQAADYLRANHLDGARLVFEPFYVGESVLAYLQRPSAFDLETGRQQSFVIWNRQELFSRHTMPDANVFRAFAGRSGDVVLITEQPLTKEQMMQLAVRPVASFKDAICYLDGYFIYRSIG